MTKQHIAKKAVSMDIILPGARANSARAGVRTDAQTLREHVNSARRDTIWISTETVNIAPKDARAVVKETRWFVTNVRQATGAIGVLWNVLKAAGQIGVT